MSFFVEVRAIDIDTARAKRLSDTATRNGAYPLHSKPTLFRRRVRKLYVADWKLGTGLLADDADWDAPTWSMKPSELPRLEATVQTLCRELPEGFEFVASWISQPLRHVVPLSCEDLLGLVRTSRLNGYTLYRVPTSQPEELTTPTKSP